MLQLYRTAAALFSFEGCTGWEKPLSAFLTGLVKLDVSWRPEGLIHDDRLPFLNFELLMLPPAVEVVSRLREKLFIFWPVHYRFGEEMLLNNQLESFPTSIQEDLVVKCEHLPHLYVELDGVAVVGVADVDIVINIESVSSQHSFLPFLQYFQKANLQLVVQLLSSGTEDTSQLLLPQLPHSNRVCKASYCPRLSDYPKGAFGGRGLQESQPIGRRWQGTKGTILYQQKLQQAKTEVELLGHCLEYILYRRSNDQINYLCVLSLPKIKESHCISENKIEMLVKLYDQTTHFNIQGKLTKV